MAIDISGLNNKVENGGEAPKGVLTPNDWNTLVDAVIENQNSVIKSIKGVILNGVTYTNPSSDGLLQIDIRDSDYIVEIKMEEDAPKIIAKGDPCIVKFTIINRDKSGTPHIFPATARFKWGDDVVGEITGIYDVDFNDPTVKNPLKNVEFDFAKAVQLSTSTEGNRLTIEVDNGEGGTGSTATKTFRTQVINTTLSSTLSGGVSNKYIFTKDNKPVFTTIYTSEDKSNGQIYIDIDGETVVNGELVESEATMTWDIFDKFNNHGLHKISIYATSVNYPDIKIYNDDIEYIFGDEEMDNPLIITNIVDGQEFEVYGDIKLNYTAYWAKPTTDNIEISIKKDGEDLFEPINIPDIEFSRNIIDGEYIISLFPEEGKPVDSLVGESVITIKLGEFENSSTINIKKTTDIVLRALGGWDVELLARDNKATNSSKTWECTNSKGKTYKAEFSDNVEFTSNGSGFNPVPEDSNYVAMRLKKGRSFVLNYEPFVENPTWSGYMDKPINGPGLTLSFEFAVRNCLDLNSEVISCIDNDGIGFKITANDIYVGSNTKNVNLSCNFKEDERIRVDIAIDGKLEKYDYNTVKGTGGKEMKGTSYESLMVIYINGVYQRLALIPQGTSFKQSIPQYIKFGSDSCDLDVYSIRIYPSTIYMGNIVRNYAADTPDTKEAISLMIRNDIFDSSITHKPSIDLGKMISTARPDLPIMYFTMHPDYEDKLPNDKETWKSLTKLRWSNPNSTDNASDGNVSWETLFGVFRNQGTSSMNYPWPWRNWDIKLDKQENGKKGYFEVPTVGGDKIEKWLQYQNMPGGLAKLTLKKDYASSEMCNNAICSELFTDMALGIASQYNGSENNDVLSPMMRENGGASSNYRLTFKATPCFAIQLLNDGKNTQSPMGMMNLIPNKNEVVYLGMDKSPYTWEESRTQAWECAENHVNWDTPYFTTWADDDPRSKEEGGPYEGNEGFGYYGEVEVKAKDENGNPILDEDGNFTYVTEFKYLGNYKNGIDGNYEARYPKDSENGWDDVDFGFAYDGDLNKKDDFLALYNEQSDILDLHNWFVLTNRYCATDKPLTDLYNDAPYHGLLGEYQVEPWNNKNGAPIYTNDTVEYRKAKFEAEAPYRLHKSQWMLYYLWREQFWMFDSGSKNLQLYTMGKCKDWPYDPEVYPAPMQWGCMVRDADTALGIDNLGVDKFPPHLEDTDCYSFKNDGTLDFHYDEAKNIFSAKDLPSGRYAVLNGQFGSIWLNIRDCWKDGLQKMYMALSANPNKTYFSAENAIKRFDDHQNKWSEALYNWGMRQYFGGTPFSAQIGSGNGNKKFSRKNWLEKGFYYRNSKYNNLADYVTWRCRSYKTSDSLGNRTVNVKTYMPMYVATGGSTTSMDAQLYQFRIADPNEGVNIGVYDNGFRIGENDTNVYLFGSDNITDLGDLARYCKLSSAGPNSTAMIIPASGMPKLKRLELGHHVDPDEPGHETAYMETVNGEEVPLTNNLALYLELNGLPALNYLDITNHVALTNIQIYNCLQLEKLYASGTDRLSNILLPQTTTLKEVHLGAGLTKLDIKDLTGIKIFDWDTSYVSEPEKDEVLEKPGMGKLQLLKIINCGDLLKGNTSYDIVKESIDSLVDNFNKGNYDKEDGTTCVIYDVNWTDVDESIIIKLLDINADITGKISMKTLSYDTKLRLLSKYKSIDNDTDKLYVTYPPVSIGDISMQSNIYLDKIGKHQLKFTVTNTQGNDFVKMAWTMKPTTSQYAKLNSESGILDVLKIGTEQEGPYADVTVTITLTNGTTKTATGRVNFFYRSCRVGDYVFNDGTYMDTLQEGKTPIGVCFYIDSKNKSNRLMVALGDINVGKNCCWGLTEDATNGKIGVELESDPTYDCYNIKKISDIPISGVTDFDENYNSINNLVDSEYRAGNTEDGFTEYPFNTAYGNIGWRPANYMIDINEDNIHLQKESVHPIGYYNTLAIIEHRNKIISSLGYGIPREDNYRSELDSLIDKLDIYGEDKEYQYFYPAASACYAYEPSTGNHELNDNFKKHTWWLPSTGEILRIMYYVKNNSAEFEKVMNDGKFKFSLESYYTTSTEWSDNPRAYTWEVRGTSRASYEFKSEFNTCRPINKF